MLVMLGVTEARAGLFVIAGVTLGAITLAVDAVLPLGVADTIPYVLVVVLTYWIPYRWAALFAAAVCSALVVLGYFLSPPGGTPWMVYTNRVLVVAILWSVAYLVLRLRHTSLNLQTALEQVSRAEKELRAANTELERFAHVVSHDLREPLRTITGFSRLLGQRHGKALDPEGMEFLQLIENGAARMHALVEQGLRSASSGGRPALTEVNMQQVAAAALRNLQGLVEENAADVQIRGVLPSLRGDEQQLTQVLQNLVANAIHHRSTKNPVVAISAERAPAGWRIAVSDNGRGIPPDQARHLLDDNPDTPGAANAAGKGIGLQTCWRIVKQHGGKLWFDSVPDRGTTFFFELPHAPAAPP